MPIILIVFSITKLVGNVSKLLFSQYSGSSYILSIAWCYQDVKRNTSRICYKYYWLLQVEMKKFEQAPLVNKVNPFSE